MATHHDAPQTQIARLVRPVLAAVVLVQALGLVLGTRRAGTPVGTWFFLDLQWADAASKQVDWAGTWLAVAGSLLVVFVRSPRLRAAGAAAASGWLTALAIGEWVNGGAPFSELALVAHATRIAAPIALALHDRPRALEWILRVAIASTFATHGFEALGLHPGFTDYLLAADRSMFALGLTQHGAEILLRLIGSLDVALAAYVLVGGRHRYVLGWMAFWGVVTATSRVVQGGDSAAHQALVRIANGGLPLALLLLNGGTSVARNTHRLVGRLARAALPLLLLVFPLAAGAQALGQGPAHLRVIWTEDPAHRATISWSTEQFVQTNEVHIDTQPRDGQVGSYARTVAAGANGEYTTGGAFYHHADVTGLLPSTTYYFVVVSDGQVSEERHFVTAPVDDRPFRLLYGGDSRKPGEADRRTMNQLIARLAEEDPTIIALAHGGDYIQSEDSWEEWNSWMADHAQTFTSSGRVLPIIPVRGNHEGDGVMFNDVFGFPAGPQVDYWVTQIGANTAIINLDTNVSIGGTQTEWLEQQLQALSEVRWLMPSYHRPAYPAVKEPSGARQFWVPLFEQYNVDMVFESDGHVLKRTVPIRDEKQDPTGVVYIGEGGLGVPQRDPNKEWYLEPPGMAVGAHHVQSISISPEQMTYEAILMDGSVGDSYVFQPKRTGIVVEPGPGTEEPGTEPGTGPGTEEPGTEPGTEEPGTEPGTEEPGTEPGTEEPGTEPGTEEPGFAPVAIDAVTARSTTEVAITFSADMDERSASEPSAYEITPKIDIQGVEMEDARTVVLTTSELLPTATYELQVGALRSAEGAELRPTRVSFAVPPSHTTPIITPAAQGNGGGGCNATGGSFAWAGLAAAAFAAARARRDRR